MSRAGKRVLTEETGERIAEALEGFSAPVAIEDALAIVCNGNTAPANIASGKYLFIKNHSTLPAGGYHATAAISAGSELNLGNVAPDEDGIANSLSEQIVPVDLSSSITYDTAKIEMYTIVVHKIGSLVVVQLNGLGSSSVGSNDDIVFGLPAPTYQVSFSFNTNESACRGKILRNTGTIRLDMANIRSKYFNISFCYVAA